ncbi:MAG: hypothetical protein HY598_04270 [Candidatus Omnitrophica bacterium]|nr:hypothetical protein [Candidatus Omnitrophota bacterium]
MLMVTELIFLSLCLVYTSIGVTRSMTDLMTTQRSLATQQAFHLAESGLDEVIGVYTRFGGNFTGWEDVSDGTLHVDPRCAGTGLTCMRKPIQLTGASCLSASDVNCMTVIDATSMAPTIDVTSAVSTASGTTTQRLYARGDRMPPSFNFAIFGADLIELNSGGPLTIDSYVGSSYDPMNPGTKGNLGTNDTADPTLTTDAAVDVRFLNANTMVHGDLYATGTALFNPTDPTDPDGNPATPDYRLDGTIILAPRLDMPPIDFPTVLTDISGADCASDRTISSGTGVLDKSCYRDVVISGTANVDIPQNANISVRSLLVKNSAQLTMRENAQLLLRGDPSAPKPDEFFILQIANTGKINVLGANKVYGKWGRFHVRGMNGFVNPAQCPEQLEIRLDGNNSRFGDGYYNDDNYLGQADFYGVLYLRNGFIWVKGPWDSTTNTWMSGEHYGSIISGGQISPATHLSSIYFKFHRYENASGIPLSGSQNYFRVTFWKDCTATDTCPEL